MERGRERLEPLDHGTLFLKALDSLNFRVTVDDLLTFILPLKGVDDFILMINIYLLSGENIFVDFHFDRNGKYSNFSNAFFH